MDQFMTRTEKINYFLLSVFLNMVMPPRHVPLEWRELQTSSILPQARYMVTHPPLSPLKQLNMDLVDRGRSHNKKAWKSNGMMRWRESTAATRYVAYTSYRADGAPFHCQPCLELSLIELEYCLPLVFHYTSMA